MVTISRSGFVFTSRKKIKMSALTLAGWLGTLITAAGALCVALGIFLTGYSLFLIGAVVWLSLSYGRRDWALFTLYVIFAIIDVIGLINLGL